MRRDDGTWTVYNTKQKRTVTFRSELEAMAYYDRYEELCLIPKRKVA